MNHSVAIELVGGASTVGASQREVPIEQLGKAFEACLGQGCGVGAEVYVQGPASPADSGFSLSRLVDIEFDFAFDDFTGSGFQSEGSFGSSSWALDDEAFGSFAPELQFMERQHRRANMFQLEVLSFNIVCQAAQLSQSSVKTLFQSQG